MSLVEVAEWWKGLHGGNYHFLVDGSRLVHLRNYAKRFKRDDVSVKYHVDIEELRDKDVILVVGAGPSVAYGSSLLRT